MHEHTVSNIWQQLEAAPRDPSAAFRTVVLCTRKDDGADGRMVILRDVDVRNGRLTFYSDARACKVAQCVHPVTLVFWDPEQQLQVRVQGMVRIALAGESVEARWRQVGEHARDNYRAELAPGSRVGGPKACAQLDSGTGRANFAVMEVTAERMDILWLSEQQRLQAARDGDIWRSDWVQM